MKKQPIFVKGAKTTGLPYSPAMKVGNTVYVSGQLPIRKEDGKIETDNITLATELCMQSIQALLKEADLDLDDIVKTQIFITDMSIFADVNSAYSAFFPENPPARSCIQVAGLPMGSRIEIEAIAAKPLI